MDTRSIFKRYDMNQPQLLPPSLDELIPEQHLVQVINQGADTACFWASLLILSLILLLSGPQHHVHIQRLPIADNGECDRITRVLIHDHVTH